MSSWLKRTADILSYVAGISLTLMMLLTVADVAMRAGGHPISGTYEIVALSLALVVGFSLPRVSLDKQHIYMDFFVERLSQRNKSFLFTLTRILCVILFLLIGFNLLSIGNEIRASGEVSPTLLIPFYPIPYSVGICCFIQCTLFVFEIFQAWSAHE